GPRDAGTPGDASAARSDGRTVRGPVELPAPTLSREHAEPVPEIVEALSEREAQVLRLLAAGLTNPEIARELVVSLATVKTHVQHIFDKLAVDNRRAAARTARPLRVVP